LVTNDKTVPLYFEKRIKLLTTGPKRRKGASGIG
jgi:hypothetical protein